MQNAVYLPPGDLTVLASQPFLTVRFPKRPAAISLPYTGYSGKRSSDIAVNLVGGDLTFARFVSMQTSHKLSFLGLVALKDSSPSLLLSGGDYFFVTAIARRWCLLSFSLFEMNSRSCSVYRGG